MADVDAELAERVARWCAEAGRQSASAEILRALAPLGWDDLLSVRALLADPPPARPLGPFALVDIARGVAPEIAAEREREGRYRREEAPEQAGTPPPPPGRRRAAPRQRGAPLVIRRARDRAPALAAAPPDLPRIEDLRRPEGRTVLERLLRRHGARRVAIARALAAGWRRDDGATPGDQDLSSLLDHHGLARAFARRERDEVLHALRAARGFRPGAAERLALDVAGLDAALARLGALEEAEQIRGERRAELRARATLAERVRLLLGEEAGLRDLGLLDEVETDLRARLPEHVRALRLGSTPLAVAFARSLSIEGSAAESVAQRFGIDLGKAPERPRRAQAARPPRRGPTRGGRPGKPAGRPGTRRARPGRPPR
jgi:hypothetical protein